MDLQKLIEFKSNLEDIAIYRNESITPKEFKYFFDELKQDREKL